MIRREDTERAVEILTRYQSTLRSPEEQELKASIGKVSHIFQSELFQALLDPEWIYTVITQKLGCKAEHAASSFATTTSSYGGFSDIHEFYDFTLRSAPLQSPSLDAHHGPARQQHGASEPSSVVTPGEPQNLPEDSSWDRERRLPTGSGDSAPGTPPRLVRVTARRTEAPASVCSLVLSSHSTLPQVTDHIPAATKVKPWRPSPVAQTHQGLPNAEPPYPQPGTSCERKEATTGAEMPATPDKT